MKHEGNLNKPVMSDEYIFALHNGGLVRYMSANKY